MYYSKNIKDLNLRPMTKEAFDQMIDSPAVINTCQTLAEMTATYRRGNYRGATPEEREANYESDTRKEKQRLPIIVPHASFEKNLRSTKLNDAIPTGYASLDKDHIADPDAFYKEHIEGHEEECAIDFVQRSARREGLHILFRIPEALKGDDAAENIVRGQQWLAERLGIDDYDAAVKDLARCLYLTDRQSIYYINEAQLFAEHPDPNNAAIDKPARKAHKKKLKKCSKKTAASMPAAARRLTYQGVKYADIIKEYFALNGGEPVPNKDRNTKLFQLAGALKHICDFDEETLLKIMPSYGLDAEEMASLVHSAVTGGRRTNMPLKLKEAINNARSMLKVEEPQAASEEEAKDKVVLSDGSVVGGFGEGNTKITPPEMPEQLPPMIELLTSRTPLIYKPAVAQAVFPSLGVHLRNTFFEYINGEEHEATLMNILIAPSSAGKSCIKKPIDHIMRDIRERDAENLAVLKEWKESTRTRAANTEKPMKPHLVVQEINPDITLPAFNASLADADGHFLFAYMNELAMFDNIRGSGGHTQYEIMCLAFDPDNRFGQTRISAESVTEYVTIRYNWNASTTVEKGRNYFRKVANDGPLSRLNFCTIPEREIGSPILCYGKYDDDFDAQLKPYIDNLVSASGTIDCPEAYDLAQRMAQENAEQAAMMQSRTWENFSFRANVIAYLKACVLYVANGRQWDETFEPFIRWSFQSDMWCKMYYFADLVEGRDIFVGNSRPGAPNMIAQLPDVFTIRDVEILRAKYKIDGGAKRARAQVYNWLDRGYTKRLGDGRYEKTEKAKQVKVA